MGQVEVPSRARARVCEIYSCVLASQQFLFPSLPAAVTAGEGFVQSLLGVTHQPGGLVGRSIRWTQLCKAAAGL